MPHDVHAGPTLHLETVFGSLTGNASGGSRDSLPSGNRSIGSATEYGEWLRLLFLRGCQGGRLRPIRYRAPVHRLLDRASGRTVRPQKGAPRLAEVNPYDNRLVGCRAVDDRCRSKGHPDADEPPSGGRFEQKCNLRLLA
jgi:hypothetical protein